MLFADENREWKHCRGNNIFFASSRVISTINVETNALFTNTHCFISLQKSLKSACPLIIQDTETKAISFAQAEETYPLKFKINQVLIQVTNHGITETLSLKEKVQFLKTDMKLLPNTPWRSY